MGKDKVMVCKIKKQKKRLLPLLLPCGVGDASHKDGWGVCHRKRRLSFRYDLLRCSFAKRDLYFLAFVIS